MELRVRKPGAPRKKIRKVKTIENVVDLIRNAKKILVITGAGMYNNHGMIYISSNRFGKTLQ